jgi:hypothetical protein
MAAAAAAAAEVGGRRRMTMRVCRGTVVLKLPGLV